MKDAKLNEEKLPFYHRPMRKTENKSPIHTVETNEKTIPSLSEA